MMNDDRTAEYRNADNRAPGADWTDGNVRLQRRMRMKDGLLPLIAVAGVIAVSVIWSLSANDPYWRLFDSESVPAPTYGASVASADFDPNADPLANVRRPSPALAVVNRIAASLTEPTVALAPLTASPQPREPQGLNTPVLVASDFAMVPRAAAAVRAGVDQETDVAIALAPLPLPGPLVVQESDEAFRLADAGMSAPDLAAYAPLPPHYAANESTEEALALGRAERVDVQRRLALAGFDPHGLDGVFGSNTRGAIQDFQAAWGFPETGYLEPAVYADLTQRTEDAYQALQRRAAATPRAAPELAPMARERQVASVEPGKCARDDYGRIVPRQSLKCDLAGFSEGFVSMGRTSVDDDEADADLAVRAEVRSDR